MMAFKHILSDIGLWFFWYPLRLFIKSIPLGGRYVSAEVITSISYPGLKKQLKQYTEYFYQKCKLQKGEIRKDQVSATAKKSYKLYVKRHIEDLFMGSLTPKLMHRLVEIEGRDNLNSALREGKGCIIQLAHFGSFMFVLPALALEGYPVNQLVGNPVLRHHRKVHAKIFQAKVKENSKLPVNFIHADKSLRPVLQALRKNELVAMALDGREGKDWVKVPFLGHTANLSPGPVRLAFSTGAKILPTFMLEQANNRKKLVIAQALQLQDSSDKEEFCRQNMRLLAEIFEEYILSHPSHFLMTMHTLKKQARAGIIDVPLFEEDVL